MPSAIAQLTGHGDVSRTAVFNFGSDMEIFNLKVSRDRCQLAATERGTRQGDGEFLAPQTVPQYLPVRQHLFYACNGCNFSVCGSNTEVGQVPSDRLSTLPIFRLTQRRAGSTISSSLSSAVVSSQCNLIIRESYPGRTLHVAMDSVLS